MPGSRGDSQVGAVDRTTVPREAFPSAWSESAAAALHDAGTRECLCRRLPEEVAKRGRDGIGRIGTRLISDIGNEVANHGLHLVLLGAATPRHRLLDGCRGVFVHRHAGTSKHRENDAAGVGELERGAGADAMERRLDSGVIGPMGRYDRFQLVVKYREALRKRPPLGKRNRTRGPELRPIRGTYDDGPTGESRAGIDTENRPTRAQETSSGSAASSNERLA